MILTSLVSLRSPSLLPAQTLHIKSIHISSQTLMNRIVSDIDSINVVTEPLICATMNDGIIKSQTQYLVRERSTQQRYLPSKYPPLQY